MSKKRIKTVSAGRFSLIQAGRRCLWGSLVVMVDPPAGV